MISPEDLATLIGGDGYNAAQVEELERAAVAFVETQTGRYFGPPALVEEYITGKGARRLWLRDHGAADSDGYAETIVADVLVRVYPGGTAGLLTDGEDFELRQLDKETILVRLAGNVWVAGYEYEVTYWRGYAEDEVPADIRQLVIDLVRYRWNGILRGQFGIKSETIGGYSYTRFDGDDLAAVGGSATIDAWKRPVFA